MHGLEMMKLEPSVHICGAVKSLIDKMFLSSFFTLKMHCRALCRFIVDRFCLTVLPYFFSCKTEVFSFQNNHKDLDPSCKMDLDPFDCFGRVILVL